jgi:hypothetical protein
MHWIVKSSAQALIAALPTRIGDIVYHKIQERHLKPELQRQLQILQRCEALVAQVRGRSLSGARIIELGSGWFPVFPFLACCCGAESVHTFDLMEHYSAARIAAAASTVLGASPAFDVYDWLHHSAEHGTLPAHITYWPNTPLESLPELPGGPADVAVSTSVLEHIPPHVLTGIHRQSHSLIRRAGVWVHMVDPSDHRADDDRKLSRVDFLRYSTRTWNMVSGHRFAYHNRLRAPQYPPLFTSAGWALEYESRRIPDETLQSLTNIPIQQIYRSFSPEDLVAQDLWFVLGHREFRAE